MTTETALTVAEERKQKADRIAADLDARTDALMDVLGRTMDVERFKRVVVLAVSKNPDLLDCTRESLIRAIMEAAQDGLEPTGPAGGAHLVPFQNKTTGLIEAVLIRDYRGLVKMALRGEVADVRAQIVYEGDYLDIDLGLEPRYSYIPAVLRSERPERGNYLAVVTVLYFRDPAVRPHIDYMTMAEIDKVRNSTRGGGKRGPWADWYDQMALKTALRNALKLRATTPEIAAALEAEDAVEGIVEEPPPAPSPRRERLVARLAPERVRGTETAEADEAESASIQAESAPPAAIVEAESLPAFDDLVAERHPATCGDPSPFDGEPCDLAPDHAGVHRIGKEQSWPRT